MKTFLLVLLLSLPIYGQIDYNRPMLGTADPTVAMQRTPIYGIQVYTQGFDVVHPHAIRGSLTWLDANGLSQFDSEFSSIGNQIQTMLSDIDLAYQVRLNAWNACGFSGVNSLNPRKLILTIEAQPFTDPFYGPNVYLADILNGNNGRIVVYHIHSGGGYSQHYKNLSGWLIGNWFQVKLIGIPSSIEQEIGDTSPCK